MMLRSVAIDVEIVDVGSVDVEVSTRGWKMLEGLRREVGGCFEGVIIIEDFDASIVHRLKDRRCI